MVQVGTTHVAGWSLSIANLANVLVRAGAIRGMELDINTDWVRYTTYKGPLNTPVSGANGTNLLGTMIGNPGRFFANWWVRDFFTMPLRPSETKIATASKTSGNAAVTPAG